MIRAALDQAEGRLAMLQALAELGLPDGWIAAGAVRNAVWDWLHGYPRSTLLNDVDVIWFNPDRAEPAIDRRLEEHLTRRLPGIAWSVKNQARMHQRNGDPPYTGCADAMASWPETATAIAVRLSVGDQPRILAPLGLDDVLSLVLRPTSRFARKHPDAFRQRIEARHWLRTWPRLTVKDEASSPAREGPSWNHC